MTDRIDSLWLNRKLSSKQLRLIRQKPSLETIRLGGEAKLRDVLARTHKEILEKIVGEAIREGMSKQDVATTKALKNLLGTSQSTAQRIANGEVHKMPFEAVAMGAVGSCREITRLFAW